LGAAGAALLTYEVASGNLTDRIEAATDTLLGDLNALDAMRILKDCGIPEAAYFNIDPKRDRDARSNRLDDTKALQEDRGNTANYHARYWFFRQNSALHRRLRQLTADPQLWKLGDVSRVEFSRLTEDQMHSPVLRPQDIHPERLFHFEEVEHDSVDQLRGLAAFCKTKEGALLNKVKLAREFNFEKWLSQVKAAAWDALEQAPVGNEPISLTSKEAFLAAVGTGGGDDFSALQLNEKQRESLRRRDDAELAQIPLWLEHNLNCMNITPEERLEEMVKYIVNIAGDHMVTRILAEYAPLTREAARGTGLLGSSWLRPNSKIENLEDEAFADHYIFGDWLRAH
jgi:hypothetical protein